jgi:TetR/AcrR family transcriptional repressor of uid operon
MLAVMDASNPDLAPDAAEAATARIVAAAREEFERYGIRRTTVEQVARRAAVSRVSVYRRFAGKAELVRAVMFEDVGHFVERFDAIWRTDLPIEERIVEAVTLCIQDARRHPLVNTLLRSEPEALLLALTLEAQELFTFICGLLAARLGDEVETGALPDIDTDLAAEALLRLGHSAVVLPFGRLPGQTEDEVKRYVRAAAVPIVLDPDGVAARRGAGPQR